MAVVLVDTVAPSSPVTIQSTSHAAGVGRVRNLALALGVGAVAALCTAGVAWADSSGPDASSASKIHSPIQRSTSRHAAEPASTPVQRRLPGSSSHRVPRSASAAMVTAESLPRPAAAVALSTRGSAAPLSGFRQAIKNILLGSNTGAAGGASAGALRWSHRRVATPTVSIDDASLTEGDSGTSTLAFTVTLSKRSLSPVTVSYATSNGTAIAGEDYLPSSGTITFARGQSTRTIDIGIVGDTLPESDETFLVSLLNPTGTLLGRAVGNGTLLNDDLVSVPGPTSSWPTEFFAPYVQMSGWPTPNLRQMSDGAGTALLILSFIQADGNGKPAWGGRSALEPGSTNAQAEAINTSIVEFKASGHDAMISFGGADGTSLSEYYAARHLSAQALADAYASVAAAYGVTHLDFDIEGPALRDRAAVSLQAQALGLLQQAHPEIKIWFTLPVLPSGFLSDGIHAVSSALEAGVSLDGVNIMALDYGESAAPTSGPNAKTMGEYAIEAALAAYAQLNGLYEKYGRSFSWSQLGVTPIIGVNDITTEIFTAADARALELFAGTRGIRMLSMWALERDTPGALGQAVWNASGVSDPAGTFSEIFNDYGTTGVAV